MSTIDEQLGGVPGRDLDSPSTTAELWLAIQARALLRQSQNDLPQLPQRTAGNARQHPPGITGRSPGGRTRVSHRGSLIAEECGRPRPVPDWQ